MGDGGIRRSGNLIFLLRQQRPNLGALVEDTVNL